MSSQVDINSLFETSNFKTLRRLETYDSILKKCHVRIKYYSTFEKTTCFFAVPEFIIGVPLYDVQELKTYMINSLTKNGFQVTYMDPNWLMIDWTKKKKTMDKLKSNSQDTIKNIKSNYKPIEEYKPSGEFIYDQSSLSTMKNKSDQMLNIGKLNI